MNEFDSPLIKYFSFIVLGLMMTIGYVVFRVFQKKKDQEEAERKATESLLVEAEFEARRLKAEREAGRDGNAEEVLTLSPEQQRERERVKRLVETTENSEKGPPEAGPEEAAEGETDSDNEKGKEV